MNSQQSRIRLRSHPETMRVDPRSRRAGVPPAVVPAAKRTADRSPRATESRDREVRGASRPARRMEARLSFCNRPCLLKEERCQRPVVPSYDDGRGATWLQIHDGDFADRLGRPEGGLEIPFGIEHGESSVC